MSDIQIAKASVTDMDDAIDFGNFVFSHSNGCHDFIESLPKLYKPEYFMDAIHYLVREGDKIKALVGSYPLELQFEGGPSLPGRGIGMVSVHPRSRSKGYMKTLMNMALEDMKKDGMAFSCLGGQRKRYEYFGYTPAGINYIFRITVPNITHTLGREWKSSLAIKTVKSGDEETLDNIMALHNAKKARFLRDRAKLFDILSSWKAKIFAFFEGDRFEGYLVSEVHLNEILEINMKDPSRISEAIGIFLRNRPETGHDSVLVQAGPLDSEKIAVLSRLAQQFGTNIAYQFNILDWKRFTGPFLALKSREWTIADGSLILKIEGRSGGTFEIKAREGRVGISDTDSAPDLDLSHLEAMDFLFGPISAMTHPIVRKKVFLQSLLPLPLFFEKLDAI